MHFKGKEITYEYGDRYTATGKPERHTKDYSFDYHITDEWVSNGDTLVNFYVQQNYPEDTLKMYTSPLYFNTLGMYCFYVNNPLDTHTKELKKYLKKKVNDTLWHTISTPLYEGKIWEGLTYDLTNSFYKCVHIDSIINTGIGNLNAFCIQVASTVKEDKDRKVINLFTEWYAQGVGKIKTNVETFLYIKKSEDVLPIANIDAVLQKVWWDDEKEK